MSTVAFLIETGIGAYLVLGEPYYGKWEYQRLCNAVSTDPTARVRFYRSIVTLEWGLVALVGVAAWLRNTGLGSVGLRYSTLGPLASALLIGGAIGLVLPILGGLASPKYRAALQRQMEPLRAMLPSSPGERLWFGLVAVTAGICEEILFRGLLIAYLSSHAPWLPVPVMLLLTSLVFGPAHLYQGWKGVLVTGLVGGVLGVLYLFTGSLLWPILLHALLDQFVWTLRHGCPAIAESRIKSLCRAPRDAPATSRCPGPMAALPSWVPHTQHPAQKNRMPPREHPVFHLTSSATRFASPATAPAG